MHHPYPSPTAMTERTRFTIAVEPEVYEIFADMAAAAGVSMSRCIGDWLRDTSEAAQMTSIKLREVREGPQRALERYIAAQTAHVMDIARDPAHPVNLAAREHARRVAARVVPPSSNTGGKSPGKTRKAA